MKLRDAAKLLFPKLTSEAAEKKVRTLKVKIINADVPDEFVSEILERRKVKPAKWLKVRS